MTQVTLQGYIQVPEADHEAVAAALPEHITLTRQEPGCVSFEVTADEAHPGRYVVNEVFASPQAFRAHQHRVNGSPWWEITRNVARHYTITGLPRYFPQPHALADYILSLVLTLLDIAMVYGVIVVSFSLPDYARGVAEVIVAPLYPGLFLYWPPVVALALLGVDWLGFMRVPRRRWRVPVFFVSNVAWVALGLGVIVLWYG